MSAVREEWRDRQVQDAVDVAVSAARGSGRSGSRLVADARAADGYLGVVTLPPVPLSPVPLSPVSRWALIVLVTPVGGVPIPMTLHTVIPSDRTEYFAQGAGWWPQPGMPHWCWAVGRLGEAPETVHVRAETVHVRARVGEQVSAVEISPDGWFAHLATQPYPSSAVEVEVSERGGWRGL